MVRAWLSTRSILVLISIVVIVILSTLGKTVNNVFSNVSHGLAN